MRIARFGPWQPPTGWQRLVERGVRAVLAEDIPDLDPAYEHVTYWWLEMNDVGQVTREIGFDPSGRAVVVAPATIVASSQMRTMLLIASGSPLA